MADWLTLKDVHEMLGIAPNTIRKLVRTGELPAFEIKGVRGPRFRREDVEALVTPVKVQAATKKKAKKGSRSS